MTDSLIFNFFFSYADLVFGFRFNLYFMLLLVFDQNNFDVGPL